MAKSNSHTRRPRVRRKYWTADRYRMFSIVEEVENLWKIWRLYGDLLRKD